MVNYRDIYSGFGYYQALPPQDAVTGGMNGVTIDRRGFGGVTFIVNIGAWTSAGAMSVSDYWKVMLEHASVSALGIDAWSEVYPSEILHSVTGMAGAYSALNSGCFVSLASNTQASYVQAVGYIGTRRYVRVRISDTGSPSIFSVGALCILGYPESWPVNVPDGI